MRSQIVRQLRRLHSYRASDPIEEELRGWNYHMPPVKPRRYLGLSMSDVAYRYCETKRDVYLRKVLKVQGEQRTPLLLGQAIHEIVKSVSNEIVKLLSSGYKPWNILEILFRNNKIAKSICPQQFIKYCEEVYKAYALDLLSDFSDSTSFIPVINEFKVDGTPLGLSSRLSVDAIMQLSLVVEMKVGSVQEFHKLALAGYGMALESALELPIDFGALIYVNGITTTSPEFKIEVFYVSSDLRKEFLDARDEVIDMVSQEKDPGMPVSCSPSCPFLSYCNNKR
ncbi:MAG: type I-A CRISPR-associated protein Cas4/Csa1 [Candidatus Micrarchaeia archaeon]|uniref:CRISPR-associated protein, Csa1 family n=1 Tax=Saccharolobus shibatae (strain ATCC 51178 / DSM 5389 / JCM 8931 / NBRC 15437 / B12) TaxID=523848 RepID=A0A8F5BP53_SACSH|nr:type I-A CRISPR-associated protein Cas4/Csa1 [Saccharolobus shibatae]MCH4816219.1 type I-A CRISPR-associated protein Cas4/Csa1 [Saccharolobus shibatae]QXJ28851.1 CRISPR-associated protein, Csa1 family [Saccharolobus shibatae B12]